MNNAVAWDKKPFQIEIRCKCKDRSAECSQSGWHRVEGHTTFTDARNEAQQLQAQQGNTYRVVLLSTGNTVE